MTSYQSRRTRLRQRMRARVAEIRGMQLSEVPYPRSNLVLYHYMFEAGEISQHQHNHLIYRHHYPLTEEIRDNQRNRQSNQLPMEHPMEGILILVRHANRNTQNRNNFNTYERIIEQHGERLAETNNSLCIECLMPVTLGIELCEECKQEERIIPEWMFD